MKDLIIKNIGTLFDPDPEFFGRFTRKKDCSVIIKDGRILDICEGEVDVNAIRLENSEIIDAEGMAVLPGFVDSHAHPVFAAPRDKEFEMRNAGKSYLEIADAGGGIKNSVRKLRAMSEEELFEVSKKRVSEFLQFGTTTLEAKSGYGLTLDDEVKMLRVIGRLDRELPIDLVPTFLGAHDIPEEFKNDREGYIDLLINHMIPKIAQENLAAACDIFIEKNYYSVEEGRKILKAAKEHGMGVKIHADQLTCNGGSELAAELDALSSDHLEYISDKAIDMMIEKNTVFNLMPGSSFFIGMTDFPPARKIIEKGGICALSTDFNPGSCHCYSLPLIMTVAAIYLHMSADELVWASTAGGARALGRKDIGNLKKGNKADILITDITELREIPYSMGMNLVNKVIKNGEVI